MGRAGLELQCSTDLFSIFQLNRGFAPLLMGHWAYWLTVSSRAASQPELSRGFCPPSSPRVGAQTPSTNPPDSFPSQRVTGASAMVDQRRCRHVNDVELKDWVGLSPKSTFRLFGFQRLSQFEPCLVKGPERLNFCFKVLVRSGLYH